MQIALWNTPEADFIVSSIEAELRGSPWIIERHEPDVCFKLLLQGYVDVAMLPTLSVLTNTELVDVLPGVAISSWDNPYACIFATGGFQDLESIYFDARYSQEALLAKILLREHYGLNPSFVEQAPNRRRSIGEENNGVLVVGEQTIDYFKSDTALNLGQEWYELSNYPMVWSLFATGKDQATPEMVYALMQTITAAENHRQGWIKKHTNRPELAAFFGEGLRLRFDDLAVASLTEFRQFLYYYNVTDEIPEVPLYEVPEGGISIDESSPLL